MHTLIDDDGRLQVWQDEPFEAVPPGTRMVEYDGMAAVIAAMRDDCREWVYTGTGFEHKPTKEQEDAWAAQHGSPNEEALVELAGIAAANEERLAETEDALVEIASMIGGEK